MTCRRLARWQRRVGRIKIEFFAVVELRKEVLRQREGAEFRVAGDDGTSGQGHVWIAMTGRLLEVCGIDPVIIPHARITVGRGLFLAAADLLARLGALFLLPLVHLDLANQLEAGGLHAKLRVGKHSGRCCPASQMDQLAFIGRIDRLRIDMDDSLLPFIERARGLGRIGLVPEDADARANYQNDADDDAYKRTHQSLQPGLVRDFGEAVPAARRNGIAQTGINGGARRRIVRIAHHSIPRWRLIPSDDFIQSYVIGTTPQRTLIPGTAQMTPSA